jgi:hypothetical protein
MVSQSIQRSGEAYTLNIPEAMKKAIASFNPRFQSWTAADYSPAVRDGGSYKDLATRAPFALILDINRDGKDDLILDGRDDRSSLLIGVISKGSGYEAVLIRESELVDPVDIENEFEGKKERGLAYYLWPRDDQAFVMAIPQQSTASGELLNDGAMIEFHYAGGKFEERSSGPI